MQMPTGVVMRRTADLVPYANNARTHTAEQVQQIAASMREFGFTNPVLISADNDIIAGHGRVLAAQLMALDEVPCIELGYLTPAQRRAYVLADNQIAHNAGWNTEMLTIELGRLKADGFDVALTGFSGDELAGLGLGEEPWDFLCMLRDAGRAAAESFLAAHGADLGQRSSYDLDVLLKSV